MVSFEKEVFYGQGINITALGRSAPMQLGELFGGNESPMRAHYTADNVYFCSYIMPG